MALSSLPPMVKSWLGGAPTRDLPVAEAPMDFDAARDPAFLAHRLVTSEADAVAALAVTPPVVEEPPLVAESEPEDTPSALLVRRGDTLMAVLRRGGVDAHEAEAAIAALRPVYDPRSLKAGNTVHLAFAGASAADGLAGFRLSDGIRSILRASRADDGQFVGERLDKAVGTQTIAAEAVVRSSLFEAAATANVPAQVMANMIRAYSWGVDFQRDIQPGDSFRILYDVEVNELGDPIRYGDIHYAALSVRGVEREMFGFAFDDGPMEYYGPDGASVKRALLRTPISGARVSSGYGMRRHPILGYSKMHKGVDFAAPTGTPIYAAGDGVVERIGRWGAYGHYIRLAHDGRISTAYAHLSRYAKGLSRGDKVEQGEVIGYVGSTGRSTGPHLHYEVLVNGEQVNPSSVDLPTGRTLSASEKAAFERFVTETRERWRSLARPTQVAARPAQTASN